MKSSAVFWGYEDLVLFGGALIPSIVLGVIAGWLVHRLFGLEKSIKPLSSSSSRTRVGSVRYI